jgi:16S rRNA (guanine527-N7)-methyltransferase
MSGESLREALETGLSGLAGVELGPAQQGMLLSYLALLEHWNKAYNLTAVKKQADMIPRHLLDSLSITPLVSGTRLLDAGTGAGLPGIPLAIARPGLDVTLLDSSGKKIRFLRHVQRQLGLENIHPVQERLESFSSPAPFDGIVSRAFSDLASFALAARSLASAATRLYAMKGRRPENELRALPDWVRVESVEKLTVPGLQEDRHLVIMSVIA